MEIREKLLNIKIANQTMSFIEFMNTFLLEYINVYYSIIIAF
jgi:hypothetical protein